MVISVSTVIGLNSQPKLDEGHAFIRFRVSILQHSALNYFAKLWCSKSVKYSNSLSACLLSWYSISHVSFCKICAFRFTITWEKRSRTSLSVNSLGRLVMYNLQLRISVEGGLAKLTFNFLWPIKKPFLHSIALAASSSLTNFTKP